MPLSAQPPASDRSREAQSSSTLEEVAKMELQDSLYQKKGRTYILFRTWLTVALVTLCSSESLDVVINSCSGAGTGSIHLFSYDVRRQTPTVSVLFGCYKCHKLDDFWATNLIFFSLPRG